MPMKSLAEILTNNVIKARLRSIGMTREDLDKPKIAIANTYNELLLPHKTFENGVVWSKKEYDQAVVSL